MIKIICKLLVFSLVFFTTGCVKKFTMPEEFYSLPPVEQNELCQEWVKISATSRDPTYYYTVVYPTGNGYDSAAEMSAAGANLGAAVGALDRERATDNLEFCKARHFATELPEGYSFYFINKSKEIELLRSEVDSLNIKATKLALDEEYKNAIEILTQALKIQENPYSYKIQAAVYILIEHEETDAGLKQSLLEKSIKSSTKVIDTYIGGYNDHFLRVYALYRLNQNKAAYKDALWHRSLKKDWSYHGEKSFDDLNDLYLSRLLCTDSDLREKADFLQGLRALQEPGEKPYYEEYNKYGSFDNGLYILSWVSTYQIKEKADKTSSDLWLLESKEETEKICKEGGIQEKQVGKSSLKKQVEKSTLIMPSEYLLTYLDQMDFRGYEKVDQEINE